MRRACTGTKAHHEQTAKEVLPRVTRYDPISIWDIDMGDRYGGSDFNEISI